MSLWFDIWFFAVVMLFELHWYRKGLQDDQDFFAFKKTTEEQLLEVNKRLEIILEREEK